MINTIKTLITPLLILTYLAGCDVPSDDASKEMTISERIEVERTDDLEMERKIDELVANMSLVEKVGQMTQVNEAFFDPQDNSNEATGTQAKVIDSVKFAQTMEEFQIGSLLAGGVRDAKEWMILIDKLQRINMEVSKSKIPFIFSIDHIHGSNYLTKGTIFPQGINLGATFEPQFSYDMGSVTTKEISHLGHHWNYAPILGIGRQKLWPRLYETFGEDSYLSSVMGASYIKGLQETSVGPYKVAGCAKHYLGYSVPNSGWDRTPAEISPQTIQEDLIPPFQATIDAGALTAMINSGEVNGVPVHASHYFLTKILRDQQGFKGVAVTDYRDIIKLNDEHFITENEKESTYLSVMAGIDISMTPKTTDFCVHLKELVEEGRIPEERINLSVRRILRLKFLIGLFDNPYPTDEYLDLVGTPEHQQKSRKAAEESIVLMKNEKQILPISKGKKVVLAGPNANLKNVIAGGWTYIWQGNDESKYPEEMSTLYQGMTKEFGEKNVKLSKKGALKKDAQNADFIVLALGESPYAEGWGNIIDLDLPSEQLALIDEAASTGKPIIFVLIEGRPRTMGDHYDKSDAALFAGLPGIYGAEAISGVLSGRINPSAKMAISYPYKSGHLISYDYKHMTYSEQNVHNPQNTRYFISEFGEGLSYTTFEYSDLQLSNTSVDSNGKITASVTVTNTGDKSGKEAVLWFLSDEVGSITRPVRELKHFDKEEINPGESLIFDFEIDPKKHLAFPNKDGKFLLEKGWFKVAVGNLEERFRLK